MNKGGFSYKRLLGITRAKQKISKATGIPLTRSGRQRKFGKAVGACYIATAIYGSYDSPEVLILRKYRDEKLLTTLPGRIFVYLYYAISPLVVSLFKEKKWFNTFWKRVLSRIILKIRRLEGLEDYKTKIRN